MRLCTRSSWVVSSAELIAAASENLQGASTIINRLGLRPGRTLKFHDFLVFSFYSPYTVRAVEIGLELAFESKELRDICESKAEARRILGDRVARMLRHRLADLSAATSPKDLVAGAPRLGQQRGTMALDLSEGNVIVFKANHPTNPKTTAGHIDWENVSRVKILRIGRGHG